MKDEFTKRRAARDKEAQALLTARITLNARARELMPYKAAIIELLHATAIVMERTAGGRTTEVGLIAGVGAALGISQQQSWEIFQHITREATED